MTITKTCAREGCRTKFTASGKGCSRAKYCLPCRPLVRREQFLKSEAKRQEKRFKEKGYVIPTDKQTLFYGYKEPLTKVKDGFGYNGVLTYSKDNEMVQCHFCGRLFKNVGSHARFTHELSAEEYKDKYGLAQNTALVGESTRTKLIQAHKGVPSFSQRGKTKKQIREHMKKMSAKAKKKGRRTGWSLEKRNKNGNCPEQLIDKIKKLQTKLDRRPTAKEYQQEYGSYASIITVYGTWENALKVAGISLFSTERAMLSDPEFLLEHLRNFYKKNKRTPRQSDMRRGLLPSHQNYYNVFGTLNKARQLAGVPVLISISKYRWDEVLLPK